MDAAEILSKYTRNFLFVEKYESMGELVLIALKIGNICPSECMWQVPTSNVQHTLSYFCHPAAYPNSCLQPSWRAPTGQSVYFDAPAVKQDHQLFTAITDALQNSVPLWMCEYNSGDLQLTKQELVQKIVAEPCFFDSFPVSVLGMNYSKG